MYSKQQLAMTQPNAAGFPPSAMVPGRFIVLFKEKMNFRWTFADPSESVQILKKISCSESAMCNLKRYLVLQSVGDSESPIGYLQQSCYVDSSNIEFQPKQINYNHSRLGFRRHSL